MIRGLPFIHYGFALFMLAITANIRTNNKTIVYSNDHYEEEQDERLLLEEGVVTTTNAADTTPVGNYMKSLRQNNRISMNHLVKNTLKGNRGLCVIGCTPYVDFTLPNTGLAKYKALIKDMAKTCDIIVHVGDTKPAKMACNFIGASGSTLTKSLHILKNQAKRHGIIALYAPGDNEINDCHRFGSKNETEASTHSDITNSHDARQHIIDDLKLYRPTDLTQRFRVKHHRDKNYYTIPGSVDQDNNNPKKYSCDFDKYVELNHYAVATVEVTGSDWYLADERTGSRLGEFPLQNETDPFIDRLFMYMNAKDCALEWIDRSAQRASSKGKRALFLMMHGLFYKDNGRTYLASKNIGDYFQPDHLEEYTRIFTGDKNKIRYPYQPLFDKITQIAFKYPNLMIYIVHSDGHRYQTIRMNPTLQNTGIDNDGPNPKLQSNHNVMIHQVEGDSRALTMYSRFTVDDPTHSFQPVTHKQEWSLQAYNTEPLGHSFIPYKGQY